MLIFVLKRVAFAVLTLLIATWIAFVLVHLSGSTPGGVALGQSATPEQVIAYNESIGWYDPWIVQYLELARAGAAGQPRRLAHRRPRRSGPTSRSACPSRRRSRFFGTLLSAVVGIVLGVIAAVRGGAVGPVHHRPVRHPALAPGFWVGVLLVYVFAVQLRLLPATGFVPFAVDPEAWAKSLVLPVLTIAITSAGRHRAADAGVDGRDAHSGAHAHAARRRHADDPHRLRPRAARREPSDPRERRHPVHRPVRRLGRHRGAVRAPGHRPGHASGRRLGRPALRPGAGPGRDARRRRRQPRARTPQPHLDPKLRAS